MPAARLCSLENVAFIQLLVSCHPSTWLGRHHANRTLLCDDELEEEEMMMSARIFRAKVG